MYLLDLTTKTSQNDAYHCKMKDLELPTWATYSIGSRSVLLRIENKTNVFDYPS